MWPNFTDYWQVKEFKSSTIFTSNNTVVGTKTGCFEIHGNVTIPAEDESSQTCRVPLLRYMTMARSVRNHFFMKTGASRVAASTPRASCWSPMLPPADRCVHMYSAKYSNNVTFFWCSGGADWALNENVLLLRSLYWTVLSHTQTHRLTDQQTAADDAESM